MNDITIGEAVKILREKYHDTFELTRNDDGEIIFRVPPDDVEEFNEDIQLIMLGAKKLTIRPINK